MFLKDLIYNRLSLSLITINKYTFYAIKNNFYDN